ncbi:hypothetical protein Hanom_Chr16g01495421 [Helianthus anomalus]
MQHTIHFYSNPMLNYTYNIPYIYSNDVTPFLSKKHPDGLPLGDNATLTGVSAPSSTLSMPVL